MAFAPHTVMFLVRASRGLGALTLIAWVIDCIMLLHDGAGIPGARPVDMVGWLLPTLPLYAAPGAILMVAARSVENGRSVGAVVIFFISILSLFKLVLLPSSIMSPYFDGPLYLELPVRGLCALLSVACAYAWQDMVDMRRTRAILPRYQNERQANGLQSFPPRTVPPPPPTERISRPRPPRDDPPASQTPWF